MPDEQLDKTAKEIDEQLNKGETEISLDQPHPEEFPPAPPDYSKPKENSKETEPTKAEDKKEPKKDEQKVEKPKDNKPATEKVVAGFKVADLLEAPLKPPEPVEKDDKKATANKTVKFLITIGIVLFVIGVALMLLWNALFGLVVVILGGVAVAISVFAPLK